jgi:hypothetical protein
MRYALAALGFITGLAIWGGPRYAEKVAARGLPAPYQGPKYIHWKKGERIA